MGNIVVVLLLANTHLSTWALLPLSPAFLAELTLSSLSLAIPDSLQILSIGIKVAHVSSNLEK